MTDLWDREEFRSAKYWGHLPLEHRRIIARLPKRFENETFDTYRISKAYGDTEALEAVEAWDMQGTLLLIGATGRGKTHLAQAFLRRYLEQGNHIGLFANSLSLARMLDDEQKHNGQLSHVYTNPWLLGYARSTWPLVVLDDFGHQASRWRDHGIVEIILERYEKDLATIITTQLGIEEHAARFGEEVASRLSESELVVCGGGDYRRREDRARQ